MSQRLYAEYLPQLAIGFIFFIIVGFFNQKPAISAWHFGGRGGQRLVCFGKVRRRFTPRESVGLCGVGLGELRVWIRLAVAEGLNHVRQDAAHLFDGRHVLIAGGDRAVEDAVKHVFDGPGELTNIVGAHHPATAF